MVWDFSTDTQPMDNYLSVDVEMPPLREDAEGALVWASVKLGAFLMGGRRNQLGGSPGTLGDGGGRALSCACWSRSIVSSWWSMISRCR